MKPRAAIPFLLAVSVVVSLWVAGPFGIFGFIVRSPIILMNDLIAIVRQALIPTSISGIAQTAPPVSTSALAASLQVPPPSPHPAPTTTPQPSPTPVPMPAPLPGTEPILDPLQNAVDPIVDSAENALTPVTDSVETAVEPVTGPVEKALDPVKDTIGSAGGNTPDIGGAVHDVKDTSAGSAYRKAPQLPDVTSCAGISRPPPA